MIARGRASPDRKNAVPAAFYLILDTGGLNQSRRSSFLVVVVEVALQNFRIRLGPGVLRVFWVRSG